MDQEITSLLMQLDNMINSMTFNPEIRPEELREIINKRHSIDNKLINSKKDLEQRLESLKNDLKKDIDNLQKEVSSKTTS